MSDKWTCTNCLKDNTGLNACTFCGAASPDNFAEHARTFNRHGGIRGLADEIDALRADNERLREECRLAAELQIRTGQEADAEITRLKAETERLLMLAAADSQPVYEENERLRAVVDAARDWCVVSGHNMPYWKDCTADPPESCTWVILRDAIESLDRHKRAYDA